MKEAMLENSPLFSALDDEQRAILASRMTSENRRAGDPIYRQGQPATAMYLLESGWARLVTDQLAVLANLGAGSLLAETDVIAGRAHSTSAEAATDVALWVLSADDLAAVVAAHPDIGRALKHSLGIDDEQSIERHLRQLELLGGLASSQVQEVASYLQPRRFAAQQTIYRRGSQGDALYLIDSGQVQIAGAAGPLSQAGPGETFGEGSFFTGEPRSTQVTAVTEVAAWSLDRADFEALALRYPVLALNMSRLVSRRLRDRNLGAAAPAPAVAAPARAPATGGGTTGAVREAVDAAISWWAARSRGARIRFIAVALLIIWLLGFAAPAAVISLLSQDRSISLSAPVASAFSEKAVLVALAADLPIDATATYTPWPTATPIPTATLAPTSTPTQTPVPTETPVPTATLAPPTATRAPTQPPAARAVAEQPAAAPKAAAAAAPAPAARSSVQYQVIEMRRLDPCENRGNHHIFITVVDAAGNPVDGLTVVQIPSGQPGNVLDKSVTGTKGPGKVEFIMWKGAEYGTYVASDGVNPVNAEIAQPLHPNFTDEQNCADGQGGNTLFHNSFSVIFRKNF